MNTEFSPVDLLPKIINRGSGEALLKWLRSRAPFATASFRLLSHHSLPLSFWLLNLDRKRSAENECQGSRISIWTDIRIGGPSMHQVKFLMKAQRSQFANTKPQIHVCATETAKAVKFLSARRNATWFCLVFAPHWEGFTVLWFVKRSFKP